jgi:glycosyltransferase involved in cell wall biosynthesis
MISIIVPVFNAEKYLKECIESIVNQDFSNFEIILIDDGSTDNSPAICDYYSEKFENVQVVHQINIGVSSARQNGVNISKGDWVIFVDSDDIVSKNMCNLIKSSICDADVIMFSENFKKNEFYSGSKGEFVKAILGLDTNNTLSKSSLFSVCSKVYRKDFLTDNKIFFENNLFNGEDMLFNINIILNTKKIKFINESFYFYRKNINSITHSYNEKITLNDRLFLEKLEMLTRFLFNEKDFNAMYNEIVLNGLFICLRKYFSHKENKYSFFKKKQKLNEFILNYPYNFALKELKPSMKNTKNPKKLILLLLKYKFTILVLLICSIQKKSKAKVTVIMNCI